MAQHQRFPLARHERRLQERVQELLPLGEEVRAAVVASKGPRAGLEAPALVGGVVGLLGGLLGYLGVQKRRSFVTVAVTSSGVVVFENASRLRPATLAARFPETTAVSEISDSTGDAYIRVAEERYWITGEWSQQLFQIRRLGGGRSPNR